MSSAATAATAPTKRTRKFRPSRRYFNRRRDYMRNPYLGGKRVSIGSCEIPDGLTRAIYHARSVFAYVVGEPRRSYPPRHHIVECLLKFACLRIRGRSLSSLTLAHSFSSLLLSPARSTFIRIRQSPSELAEPSLFLSLRSASLQTFPDECLRASVRDKRCARYEFVRGT